MQTRLKKWSKWTKFWLAWLMAFLIIEIASVTLGKHGPKPRTLTEHARALFPRKFWRIILVGLMALLTWHFWQDPQLKPMTPIVQEYCP